MPVQTVRNHLDEHGVKYRLVEHSPAYTAQQVAAEAHVPGRHFAKVVAVKVDDRLALAVLPATDQVDCDQLATSIGAGRVEVATEDEFRDRFPGCEVGAMPPFGNLFAMETFVSPHLAQADRIAFNAGTHTEVMELSYSDYARLVDPAIVRM